jgi:hypothetical protein
MTGSLTGERAALMARRATAKAAAALGSRSTRSRKVYEITAAGELLFEQLLEAPDARGEEARTFSLRLAFPRHLSPTARVRLLDRRRMQLTDRLEDAERSLIARARTLDCYEHAIAEHARDTVASDLVWVERLLAAEHARAIGVPATESYQGVAASVAPTPDAPATGGAPVSSTASTTGRRTDT